MPLLTVLGNKRQTYRGRPVADLIAPEVTVPKAVIIEQGIRKSAEAFLLQFIIGQTKPEI